MTELPTRRSRPTGAPSRPVGAPDRRRRPVGLAGGRPRPAPALRRGAPDRAGQRPAPRRSRRCASIKLRGGRVAVLLADYRMPEMNGIEFLEAGDGPVPAGPARAADGVRRHRRGDRRDQRRRRRPLPAQAVGPAGGEALPGRRRDDRGVRRPPRRRGHRDQGDRPPVVAAVVRGPRLPGPQRGALPLVRRRRAGGRSACSRRPASDADTPPRRHHPRRHDPGRAARPAELADGGRAVDRPRPPTSTTSSSSVAARPGSARRSTAPPRVCARCSSSGRRPAARPASPRGSRTTSASPTASPAPSSPTARAGRRPSSAPRSSPRETSPGCAPTGSARVVDVRRRHRGRRARR